MGSKKAREILKMNPKWLQKRTNWCWSDSQHPPPKKTRKRHPKILQKAPKNESRKASKNTETILVAFFRNKNNSTFPEAVFSRFLCLPGGPGPSKSS